MDKSGILYPVFAIDSRVCLKSLYSRGNSAVIMSGNCCCLRFWIYVVCTISSTYKPGGPTGTTTVVIRKGSDDSIAATLGTIDVSTLTNTDKLYTFTNTSNTYKIAAGDKLLIE
jgi:hypothetical protein